MKRFAMAVIIIAFAVAPLQAIPAFARKYGISCASCHDPIPRLTPYGEQFMANGYALAPGDTTGTTSLGDPMLVLNSIFPIAMRLDAYLSAQGGRQARTDFAAPYVVKLLSGGPIARNVSYYVYLVLAEDGLVGPLEDANVTFSNLFGAPLSLTVGQFQIIDPLWKRELRITLEDYAILKQRPGTSSANLTYDRGVMFSLSPTASTTIVAELVNGNGIGEAVGGTFDGDSPKTGFLALTQAVGPFRLSVLGYYGSQDFTPTGQTAAITNQTRMLGPALSARLGQRIDIGAQYLYREDSDPGFAGIDSDDTMRGGFVEANWWPKGRGSRLLVTGLFNSVNSSVPGSDYETGALNLSWLHSRNLRLASEFRYDLVADRAGFALGLSTAF